jgi:hypothetical protein
VKVSAYLLRNLARKIVPLKLQNLQEAQLGDTTSWDLTGKTVVRKDKSSQVGQVLDGLRQSSRKASSGSAREVQSYNYYFCSSVRRFLTGDTIPGAVIRIGSQVPGGEKI